MEKREAEGGWEWGGVGGGKEHGVGRGRGLPHVTHDARRASLGVIFIIAALLPCGLYSSTVVLCFYRHRCYRVAAARPSWRHCRSGPWCGRAGAAPTLEASPRALSSRLRRRPQPGPSPTAAAAMPRRRPSGNAGPRPWCSHCAGLQLPASPSSLDRRRRQQQGGGGECGGAASQRIMLQVYNRSTAESDLLLSLRHGGRARTRCAGRRIVARQNLSRAGLSRGGAVTRRRPQSRRPGRRCRRRRRRRRRS